MKRTIEQQLSYSTCSLIRTNYSKRQYRMTHGGKTDGYLFSNENIRKYRDTIKSFAKFIHKNYPEVKLVKNITTEMLQAWIDANRNNWSDATMAEKISQLKMIFLRVERVYHCEAACEPLDLIVPPKNGNKKRSIMISCEHIIMIRDSFASRDAKCAARIALELAVRLGLRVKECEHLHPEDINLERRYVYVCEGGKGGKRRYVPIREADYEYFRELKDNTKNQEYVLGGVTSCAINKAIRREMKALGIDKYYLDTTTHSVRKHYAVTRYKEERLKGKDEIEAWETVQCELGHGPKFRLPLFKAYIAEPMKNEDKTGWVDLADLFEEIELSELEG